MDEDGGRLWGRSLDGPLLLVDPETRSAVANRTDGKGVLVTADFSRLVVSSPVETHGPTLAGAGWTLTLKPGWKTAPGTRPGDLQLIHP